mmetsp:Transcript_6824/g.12216  ORF Transcript_6824/g.12216 Transcript_6824/m.12216 type:complete len:143 (-) Transcript_6824:1508-1936(-)
MFSKQHDVLPHPLEQIASDRVRGMFPGVALQHPSRQDPLPSVQKPLGEHTSLQTPECTQSAAVVQVFSHRPVAGFNSNPSSGQGFGVATGDGVAVGASLGTGVGLGWQTTTTKASKTRSPVHRLSKLKVTSNSPHFVTVIGT